MDRRSLQPVFVHELRVADKESVIKDATEFFGESTEGLGKVIEKAFKDQGRPNGYIRGEEIAGAVGVGLRYGDGTLTLKNGASTKVYWEGPSLGFDLGANASKVFVLVYRLPKTEDIFKRYPGVDGSLYYVAGAGINYQQRDKVVLAAARRNPSRAVATRLASRRSRKRRSRST